MRIGIIGAGNVGRTLARLFARSGNEVVICNSRSPDTLRDTVAALGGGVTAGTLAEVCAQEMVVLAVWWDSVPEVLSRVADWQGRILIDTTNQLSVQDGKPRPVCLDGTTGSERVAALANGARVVKAFNSLFAEYMDGETDGDRRVLFYAGDDAAAKAAVRPVFEAAGFFPVDLGTLAEGGLLMQVGGVLNGKHFIVRKGERCL